MVGTAKQDFSGEKRLWSTAEEPLLPRSAFFVGEKSNGLGVRILFSGAATRLCYAREYPIEWTKLIPSPPGARSNQRSSRSGRTPSP